MRSLSLILLLLATPALAEEAAHLAEADGLRVLHAWTAATDRDPAFVYLEIENTGATDRRLLGAETPAAATVALTGFVQDGGTLQEVPVPEVRLTPGMELDLAPGELALRLSDLAVPLAEGDHLDLTLIFDTGPLAVEVAVEAAGATAHSHAGHAH